MARYINEDEFIAWVKEHWCADCQNDNGLRCRACWIDDAIDIVEEAPEADVVPRAKIEEIFKEIEKIILDNTYPDFNREHKPVNVWKATTGYDAFYELKKKYTGGEKK